VRGTDARGERPRIAARRGRWLLTLLFLSIVVVPIAMLRGADAACIVTTGGTVRCNADTVTTDTANLDGASSLSSDRTQRFDNGAAIHGAVRSGVIVGGFGLELTEGAAAPRPITMNNQGEVTTTHAVDAAHIDGNGGAIRYTGDGGVDNRSGTGDGLFVDNMDGDISIVTGAGAIHGATGIFASTTGAGTLNVVTGSGLVSGETGRGIFGSTVDGALSVTVGSGGIVNHGNETSAIVLTSTNGDISVTAGGDVAGRGAVPSSNDVINIVGGVHATSNGTGNITVGGSGTFFGQYGRGIWAAQSATGLGGILITGSGATNSGTATLGCCSAIRAEIDNPADSSDIIVDRSGDITAVSTLTPAEAAVSAGIHVLTLGTGNIVVAGSAGATISNTGLFGIEASAFGPASFGSITVSTIRLAANW
jgi:hypothetical protein